MELIIIIVAIIAIIIVNSMMKMNVKQLEKIALDSELNEITKKYPKNIEICKAILKKLGNRTTNIKEDTKSNATLYIAIQDKISIGNTHESFTRIQTMAHECLHSIQDRRILMFNFIFSNIYLIYFGAIIILTIFKIDQNSLLYLSIFLILSMVYYMVRVFLEDDAMIKAKYLAKEYMEEAQISSKEEINKIVEGFENLNNAGIKCVNYNLFSQILIKVIIFSTVALIF